MMTADVCFPSSVTCQGFEVEVVVDCCCTADVVRAVVRAAREYSESLVLPPAQDIKLSSEQHHK